jgi:hypothetical protein
MYTTAQACRGDWGSPCAKIYTCQKSSHFPKVNPPQKKNQAREILREVTEK